MLAQLTLHSDRGSPMRAKGTAELLVDLGVAASYSRPRVSNDNPHSEAQFKTLKYQPEFPEHFEGDAYARAFLRTSLAGTTTSTDTPGSASRRRSRCTSVPPL
ncbi:MAG: transposase family protein [Acidimicrobiia bacterium]|nr:transposase family protein [Acidimicrobiia bacterium]